MLIISVKEYRLEKSLKADVTFRTSKKLQNPKPTWTYLELPSSLDPSNFYVYKLKRILFYEPETCQSDSPLYIFKYEYLRGFFMHYTHLGLSDVMIGYREASLSLGKYSRPPGATNCPVCPCSFNGPTLRVDGG